ncbi:transglycosylase domain-containing protein [Clostridium aminobutyricum]|uniref:Penicillin-binding protein 1A n=1 Tax=Clostridium aminobutyricum TaxID=33953 RepID=A0A939IIP0_CLOAM|nr:transglycosylase domain-containing protein [Clostridium aminobutyricum]MBN7772753.1 transglycosylase domain-containing protein [Clostridium aminobutyricum]
MSDEFNKDSKENQDKLKKIDDFFSQFEEKQNDSHTDIDDFLSKFDEMEKKQHAEKEAIIEQRRTRMDRLNEKKSKKDDSPFTKLGSVFSSRTSKEEEANEQMENSKTTKKGKKKHRLNIKKFLLFLFGACVLGGITLVAFTISVIAEAPEVNPDNIYTLLNESSVLYDDQGNVIENVFASGEGARTNVTYDEIPDNVINAFVALEDKTFWKHHGFNFIRILGAIKEGILSGDNISGTSTITQQLARNIYLTDIKSEHSLKRKIKEAYYTVLLEKHLTKKQIIEAYLNTIYLGGGAYGVQAASEAYFSKDIKDLDLLESASLAALPQAPHSYALIKKLNPEDVEDPESDNILLKGDVFTYVFNDISKSRRELCLKFMKEQEYITEEQESDALKENLRDHLKSSAAASSDISSYFADYVLDQVTQSLMDEMNISYEEATQRVYSSGLQIHTTLNSDIQKIAEKEFSNKSNFPGVANLKKDKSGNVISDSGNIMLYSYNNYFNENGNFVLNNDEYKFNSDHSLTLYKGKRLTFSNIKSNNKMDYSIDFKNMYTIDDGIFYSIGGGVISIPQEYKSKDTDGNLVISAQFFKDKPNVLDSSSNGITVSSDYYTLRQKVVQPQSAMVITDPYTGAIKAMVGGRNTVGKLLFNRATSTRQPGSSIKPISVYGPALQYSVDSLNSGTTLNYKDSSGVSKLFGDYFTAASVIDDTPLTIQGKLWPKNWYSGYKGLYTLRTSVEQSVNVNAVRIFQELGVQRSLTFLKKLGVTSVVESGDSNDMNAAALALGGMTHGISPLEMSAAYGAFVNDGKYTEPISFTKVTNKRGELLLENDANSTQVMDPGVAFIMRDILLGVVSHGLGSGASISTQPAGGKTGTTTDNYDAWFVGFTPQYSASVWIGNDVNIELSQGSASAAKLWGKIMGQVGARTPKETYHGAPSNVISVGIDMKSGKLPSELSYLDPRSTVRNEYFIAGTEPKTTDNVHTYVTVCTESGYLATPACHSTKTVLGVKRPYGINRAVGDSSYEVPHYYCNIHNTNTGAYPIDPNANGSYTFEGVQPPATPGDTEQNPDENQNPNGNSDQNHSGNGNGNDGNTDENGNSTIPDWIRVN